MLIADAAAAEPPPARPPIVWDAIPYDSRRKADMRRYSRRHYGLDRWQLRSPKSIVLHMTAGPSYRSAWNTFAPNRPDRELHELPGTCAHFVIDQRGKVFQLVPLGVMCRHTVGLNWTAIGIEHVGTRESGVLERPRVRRASVRLVKWLQARHEIADRHVIGHNENRSSPYHRERVARLRSQTHGDWAPRWARRYRALLR